MTNIIIVMFVTLPAAAFTSELLCSSFRPNTMKFSLQSRRNETGHWTAQVKLQHGGKDTLENSVWDVDVEQSIVSCGGIDKIDIQVTLTAPLKPPGPGYELVPRMGYYKFHPNGFIWQDALRVCAQEGAHLAIINSEAESKFIKELYARYPTIQNTNDGANAFMGYHDITNEGVFETIFGHDLNSTGFKTFANGQPNNAPIGIDKDQDCGGVTRGGLLNDLPCNTRYAFICERELIQ